MATNVIEILLKFRKDGGEVLTGLTSSLSDLKKSLEVISSSRVDAGWLKPLEEALKSAGVSTEQVKKQIQELSAITKNPISSAYAQGLVEAMQSTDKAALRAKLSLAEVQNTLSQGGAKAAYLVGLADALGDTSKGAEDAREAIKKIDGVDLSAVKSSVESVTKELDKVGGSKGVSSLTGIFKTTEGSVGSLTGAVKGLAGAFLALSAVGYLKSAAETAARTEVLGTVLYQVGKNAGYTKTELDKADKAVQNMGITAAASRESLTQLINSGLNLSLAAPLARASQDLAVIAGWNSSETFSRLLVNIAQMDTMGLRMMGITVSRIEAENKYAQSLGKSADALSSKEQKEAFAAAVMVESTKNIGTYEAAMSNAGKQAQSLARYKENLAVTIGDRLLPAYLALVEGFADFIGASEKSVKATDANNEAGKGLAETVKLFWGVLRDIRSVLSEHTELVMGVVGAYAALKIAMALSAAAGTATLLGAMVGAFSAVGVAITNVAALFAWFAGGSFTATAAVLGFSSVLFPVIAVVASLFAAWKIFSAYKEKIQAEDALRDLQKKLSETFKKIPEEQKKMWDDLQSQTSEFVKTDGKSKEQITETMNKVTKGMEYAGARYALAMSKGKEATEEDLKVIREYDAQVKVMIETQKRLGIAREQASKAAPLSKDAQDFVELRSKVDELTASYGSASNALKDYQAQLSKAMDSSYKLAETGLKTNYREEQAILAATEVFQGQNRQKMMDNDKRYFSELETLYRQDASSKQDMLRASTDTAVSLLTIERDIKLKDNIDAKSEIAAIAQAEQKYAEQSLSLQEQNLSKLSSLRDEAFNKYVEQLRKLQDIERSIQQENLSHEVKISNLKMRLQEDGFRAREDSLRSQERSLADRERIANQTGDKRAQEQLRQERESISRSRDQISRDRESMEKNIEAMSQSKFQEWAQKARDEIAKGADANLALADEYMKIAGQYGSASKSVATQISNENTLHDLKISKLQLEADTAKSSAESTKKSFNSMTEAVYKVTDSISNLIIEIAKMSNQNQMLTFLAKLSEVEDKMKELSETREGLKAKGGTFWSPTQESEYQRSIAALGSQAAAIKRSTQESSEALDKFVKARKLEIDTSQADRAKEKMQEVGNGIDEVYGKIKGGAKVEIDTSTASGRVLKFTDDVSKARTEVDSARKDMQRELALKLQTAEAQAQLKDLSDRIAYIKRGISENQKLGMDTSIARANLAVLQDEVKKLKGETRDPIALKAITDEAVSKLRGLGFTAEEARNSIGKPWSITITDNATGAVKTISDTLDGVKRTAESGISVKVTAETTVAEQEIDAIDTVVPPVDVPVSADTSQALSAIGAISGAAPAVVATISAETSQVDSAMSRIQGTQLQSTTMMYANDSAVQSAKSQAQQGTYSYHTIYVRKVEYGNTGGLITDHGIAHFADGGFARVNNGLVSGPGTGLSDSIPAMIANGEFIIRRAAVEHYGIDLVASLNNMVMPKVRGFASGGLVGDAISPRSVPSPTTTAANDSGVGSRDIMDINLNIGGTGYRVQSARDTAKQLAGALRELSRAS